MSQNKDDNHKVRRSKNRTVENENKVIFDMPSCGGCRTCELACSFHHTGEFGPQASSLKIVEKDDGPGYLVSLNVESGAEGMACDRCKDLEVPLCMEYCKEIDDLGKILNEFEEIQNKTQED